MSRTTEALEVVTAVLPEVMGLVRDLIGRHGSDVPAIKAELARIRDHGTAWAAADDRGRAELDQMRKAGG